jgi:hypothetical protein
LQGRNLRILKKKIEKSKNLKGKQLEAELDDLVRQNFKLDKDVEDLCGFSASNRNFFIRLYRFSQKNPQFRYVTMSYSDIKARGFKRIQKCMDDDETFNWKEALKY